MANTRTEEWQCKMTAKAAWKLGLITREQFDAIRRENTHAQVRLEDAEHAQLRKDLQAFQASLRGEAGQ